MITYKYLGRNGRLGNQLWQIASTIGIARRRDEPARFPFWRYEPYFRVPESFFSLAHVSEGSDLGRDYLQDLNHLEGVELLVRGYFQPSDRVEEQLRHRYRDFFRLEHKTSVHVRRGDYTRHSELFALLPVDYYLAAMERTRPPHVIFSDDLSWSRKRFGSGCWYMEHNRDYEDLFLMAACDEHVTANSTFSWWGAWLSGGRAIYPRSWFGEGFGHIDPSRFIPRKGIVI